ncbi:MAG: FtsX-like permease family protein [Lachnospiraceae bacterium]|nr:FtsX-like permease family protein [Lachnospiraceae bacterium]
MTKYYIISLFKNKLLYMPLLIILSLVLYMSLCSFDFMKNVNRVYGERISKYSVAVIAGNNRYRGNIFSEEHLEEFNNPKYISDYYAFNQFTCNAKITPTPFEMQLNEFGDYDVVVKEDKPFTLIFYSDISKSTHFKLGDRKITEGRFAEDLSECNISEDLAILNGLSVGDVIEVFFYYNTSTGEPDYFEQKIVGIYEDNTDEANEELELVGSVNKRFDAPVSAGFKYVSRTQILTAVSSVNDLAIVDLYGFNRLVYYANNDKNLLKYIDELNKNLPPGLTVLDSTGVLSTIIYRLDKTQGAFIRLLTMAIIGNSIFCAFLLFYILKERTYDIGVFRIKGMSKTKTAILFSSEIFTVSVLAFIIAFLLYLTTFEKISAYFHNLQEFIHSGKSVFSWERHVEDSNYMNSLEFIISLTSFDILILFLTTVIFSIFIGIAAILFISRHEPMKTMIEY